MLYIASLVPKHQTDEIVLGVSKTITGAVLLIKERIGNALSFEVLQTSPTRMLFQNKEHGFIAMIRFKRFPDTKDDTLYLITRKYPDRMYETVCAVYDTMENAESFIYDNVEEPTFTKFEPCKIIKVDGLIPFRKILGDEHPDLNRVSYFVYEMEIYDIKRKMCKEKEDDIKNGEICCGVGRRPKQIPESI